jgi:hypothetical protein
MSLDKVDRLPELQILGRRFPLLLKLLDQLRNHNPRPCHMGDAGINVKVILRQEISHQESEARAPLLRQWPGAHFEEERAIGRISAVGACMPCTPGTTARLFRAMADQAINIKLIATSAIHAKLLGEQSGRRPHPAGGGSHLWPGDRRYASSSDERVTDLNPWNRLPPTISRIPTYWL